MRILLLCFCLLVSAPLASAQEYSIVELRATGSKRFPAADVIAATGLKADPSQAVSLAAVREAAGKLSQSGVFAQVSYRHAEAAKGMKVEFTLEDKPPDQFVPARFENIVWLPAEQLTKELHRRLPLFHGELPLDGTLSDQVAAAIQSILAEHQVPAHVSGTLLHNLSQGTSSMNYAADDITVNIAAFEFPGASPDIAAKLQSAAASSVGKPYLHRNVELFGEEAQRAIYFKLGYLRASFAEPAPRVVANEGTVTRVAVALPVTEGPIYNFKEMHFDGNKVLTEAQLRKFLHLYPGISVDGQLLDYELMRIRAEYSTLGYMHMTLDQHAAFDDAAATVAYDFTVHEGELFTMGKFEVEGAQKAEDEALHAAFRMREGDPFDAFYLQRYTLTMTNKRQDGRKFVLEQSEGERPGSVDVTLVFCKSGAPCEPKANVLAPAPAPAPISGEDKHL